ncbi:hypothetical protein AOR02nite_11720 [Acetobacter orientalis]|uniref:Uncharacterized protein n=1 Tax=Acetobacter orientalis TaxID=146474 RepID=A0A0D6NIH6_9PROT|nr:hypothetical protein Abor_013_134 [Acetobacter orientalis]GEL61330.1 hypothetical protein AOR02nite_11720 [Acetobacter orientalis]
MPRSGWDILLPVDPEQRGRQAAPEKQRFPALKTLNAKNSYNAISRGQMPLHKGAVKPCVHEKQHFTHILRSFHT